VNHIDIKAEREYRELNHGDRKNNEQPKASPEGTDFRAFDNG